MYLNFSPIIDQVNSLGITVTNEFLKTRFKMLFLMKERVQKKEEKMLFITELNYLFASILACQLKKLLLNPYEMALLFGGDSINE